MTHNALTLLRSTARVALLASCLAGAGARGAPQTSSPQDGGRELYEQHCGACHSPDVNRAGPMHRGVFGRRVGMAPGFAYSKALRNAQVVWNEKSLEAWLQDPEKLIPGQQMFVSIDDQVTRAQIIQFLRTLK